MVAGAESYQDREGLQLWYGEQLPDEEHQTEPFDTTQRRIGRV